MFGGSIWGVSREMGTLKLCQDICLLIIYWYHNTGTQVEMFKKLILGGTRGVAPPNYVKILVCKVFADIKKTNTLA